MLDLGMNMRCTGVLLLCMLTSACRKQAEPERVESILRTPQVKASQLSQCPNGHTNLVDVPVMYGLVERTDDLKQKVDNHEVVLGGCVMDNMVKSVVRCVDCDLLFNHPRALATWLNQSTMTDVQPTPEPY